MPGFLTLDFHLGFQNKRIEILKQEARQYEEYTGDAFFGKI